MNSFAEMLKRKQNEVIGNIAILSAAINENAKEKGFYDKHRETGTLLMLVVSELSEAMEADRKDSYANFIRKYDLDSLSDEEFKIIFERDYKDSFQDELADALIRILDICGSKNINIGWHVIQKMRYNTTRKIMHGKKY